MMKLVHLVRYVVWYHLVGSLLSSHCYSHLTPENSTILHIRHVQSTKQDGDGSEDGSLSMICCVATNAGCWRVVIMGRLIHSI